MGIVTVKPIEKKDWRGNAVDKDIPRPVVYEIMPGRDGKYASGLDDEKLNFDHPEDKGEKKPRKVTEKQYYEMLLGEQMPTLFIPTKHKDTYWAKKSSRLVLEYRKMTFDTSDPRDYVKVKNMKASRYVANSLEEYNKGNFPQATHYIHDEEEEMGVKAKRAEKKNAAFQAVLEMTKDQKLNLCLVLHKKDLSKQSDDYLTVITSELVEKRADEVLQFASRNPEDSGLHAKIIALNLKNQIFVKEGRYMFGDISLGINIEQVIDFLKDDKNNEIKIALFQKLN